jgi:alanine dehydrogenase
VTRLLRDRDVRSLVSFPEAIEAVSRGVVSAAADGVAERSIARLQGGWLRIVSGALPSVDLLGFKAFHLVPGAGVRYLLALYRLSDGEPLALLDANYITVARTSAAAAAAAAKFFGEERIVAAIVGTGTLARDGMRALASVCEISSARVYSRSEVNRSRFVAELGEELGIELASATSAATAVGDADIVLCATQTSGAIALTEADAGSARYVSSVSSTLPDQRELDERLIAGAGLIVVDTAEALRESGDLLAAAQVGLDESKVTPLAHYLAESDRVVDSRVVYKSIGSVEQDLSLAAAVWQEAERRGAGDAIEPIEQPRA